MYRTNLSSLNELPKMSVSSKEVPYAMQPKYFYYMKSHEN